MAADNGSNLVKAFREFRILFGDRDGDNDNEETAEDIVDDDILLDELSFDNVHSCLNSDSDDAASSVIVLHHITRVPAMHLVSSQSALFKQL